MVIRVLGHVAFLHTACLLLLVHMANKMALPLLEPWTDQHPFLSAPGGKLI